MLSLRALLAAYKTLLVIDSSSATIQVGLFQAGVAIGGEWEKSEGEAGTAVFQNLQRLLGRTAVALAAVEAIAFCEGPGSVLGIRSVAVAIRTWNVLHPRPCFAFSSLTVVAHGIARKESATEFSVIADARRDSWHRATVDRTGQVSPLQRVPLDQLSGQLIMPEGFRHWAPPPANLIRVHYDLAQWLPLLSEVELFRPTEDPDAFLHEEPQYQPWTPRVHRAPS